MSITLIPPKGTFAICTKGTDCPDDQVCDNLKCVSCKEGTKPDEDREKCTPTSIFYKKYFINHRR